MFPPDLQTEFIELEHLEQIGISHKDLELYEQEKNNVALEVIKLKTALPF